MTATPKTGRARGIDEGTAIAAPWLRRFAALRDLELRIAYARHELGRLTPDTLVALLTELSAGAEAGAEGPRDLLATISAALLEPRLVALREAAAALARERDEIELARRLGPVEPGEAPEPTPRAVPDFGLGRPPTLGERKSLARTRDRPLIARLLRDPHPSVIRVLLENPALTEDDVLRLCAFRPIEPAALREVFSKPRWSSRYRVQLALVKNPRCPVEIALSIVSRLRPKDARDVASAPELDPHVRRAAHRRCGGRTVR